MTENSHYRFGIHRLHYALTGLEIVFDPRVGTISFIRGNQADPLSPNLQRNGAFGDSAFSIRLEKFVKFEEDLKRLDRNAMNPAWTILLKGLQEMAGNREPAPREIWSDAIGEFAFFLLRYSHKHNDAYLSVAKDILLWLGAPNARTAWRLAYDERLAFEHRYKLLKEGQSESRESSKDAGLEAELDLSDQREREFFWWGTLVKYELSRQWCESETYGNPAARQAVRESAIEYLHVLKDEPRQHDLKRFLSECGTDVEREVKGVLFGSVQKRNSWALRGRSNSKHPEDVAIHHKSLRRIRLDRLANLTHDNSLQLANDEVIRRAFFVWFLKRYDLWSGWKLGFSASKTGRMKLSLAAFLLFNFMAVLLYVAQTREFDNLPHYFFFLPSPETGTPVLWGIQAMIQLSSLLSVLLIAPLLFRLFMPRALFGSLLAWSTVIFTALRDVHELKMGESEWPITSLCHSSTCSDAQAFGYTLLICAGILTLDLVFIGYTVTQFTEGFRATVSRILITLSFLLAGSLFWGLIFALPIKVALERDAFIIDCHCIIPIVLIGSSIAVLFGLMLELIWQDQSLAEPLGEPL